jgi:hypothetical protein
MAEGHNQGPGGGGRNVGHLRLRVHTWLQDTVLGVPVLMMLGEKWALTPVSSACYASNQASQRTD